MMNCISTSITANEVKLNHLINIDRGKHILEHGRHEFKLHSVATEVIHDEQRVMQELTLRRVVPLQ